jgi:leucyl/phenylalanyl-tRNA--protein transferase
MIAWLGPDDPFPPLTRALRDPNGLLAAGGDLSPERLIAAYRHGIFPWFNDGDPPLWWSPDPRTILEPAAFHVSRSLGKCLRQHRFAVTSDRDFAAIVSSCATTPRRGQTGTWITAAMQAAYRRLHELGYAHSVEVWHDGKLAGGVYGVAMDRVFFAESMFSRVRDASKVALARLSAALAAAGYDFIDCQLPTDHLHSLGARELSRADFARRLGQAIASTLPGVWPAEQLANPD